MAEAPGMKYRAVKVIEHNGVVAYQPGHLVHEDAVTGDGAWLTVGEDVEPREDVRLAMPARNAPQAQWAAYAVSQGADEDEAAGMSRAALIEAYGPQEQPPAVEAGIQVPPGSEVSDAQQA